MPASSCRSEVTAGATRPTLARAAGAASLGWALAAAALAAQPSAGGEPPAAPPVAASAAVAVAAGWDFTLPTLDGSHFVRLRDAAGPVLVNFWGIDCPPCVAELPLLMAFARAQPAWTVLLVGTDPAAAARAFLARLPQPLPANVRWLRGGGQARALLREAGSRHGGLPHSVALAPAAAGACGVHAGRLTPDWLSATASSCIAPMPPPAPEPAPARAGRS